MRIKEFLQERELISVNALSYQTFLQENILLEGRGLGARAPGDEFVATNDPETKIYVDNVKFYPEGGGQYKSNVEVTQAYNKIHASLSKAGNTVSLISPFNKANLLAFGVATFTTPDGIKMSYIKPFIQVDPDPTRNKWDNQKGIPGFKFNSRTAAKGVAGMSPQDILKRTDMLTAKQVVDQIAEHYGKISPLTLLAANIAGGANLPLEISAPEGMSFTAFRDYFCELLHPIAIQKNLTTGNAAGAAKKFLPGGTYQGTKISYGSSKTEGLSDSILTADNGASIKVSSKGGRGAEASVSSLLKAANEIQKSNPKLYKQYRATIDLIKRVKDAGQHGSPLMLGVEYGIINEKEADTIRDLRGQALMPLAALESMKISARLKKMLKESPPKDTGRVNFYYHAMATVAHKVADYINDNTDFGSAASAILNNGALVQVHTIATAKGNRWKLERFEANWPSDTVTGVKFSADKPYYSKDIKGNFTFKILRNGQRDLDEVKPKTQPVAMSSRAAPKPKVTPRGTQAKTPADTKSTPRKRTE